MRREGAAAIDGHIEGPVRRRTTPLQIVVLLPVLVQGADSMRRSKAKLGLPLCHGCHDEHDPTIYIRGTRWVAQTVGLTYTYCTRQCRDRYERISA